MSNSVIEIKDLSINYRNLQHFSIQTIIGNRDLGGRETIHAVRGVDLSVDRGEIVGIVGPNGAGKSTLLKAIAGIFQPDSGSIDTKGNRVSLMSLGVGFKWDLSGRDNIMIAGLLLRYPAQYIKEKTADIIEFSELGEAIDRPVRTYSDGMYAKLCFAITAVLETDIMLIDELLSVGDEKFQKKSYDRIASLVQKENMTGIIVSHDLELIRRMCTRAVWMNNGRFEADGTPAEVTEMYARRSAIELFGRPKLYDTEPAAGGTVLFRGIDVDENSGMLMNAEDRPGISRLSIGTNWEPFGIKRGSEITLLRDNVLFRVFAYRDSIPKEYIYTSTRPVDGNNTLYDRELSTLRWTAGSCTWDKDDCLVRFVLRTADGTEFEKRTVLEDLIKVEDNGTAGPEPSAKTWEESLAAAEKSLKPGDVPVIVIADTHVGSGGKWKKTAEMLSDISSKMAPYALIHLGDVTDGNYPLPVYVNKLKTIRSDLEKCGTRLMVCAGNHDLDLPYAGEHREEFTKAFSSFCGRTEHSDCLDIESCRTRLITLDSYDPDNSVPYGYDNDQIEKLAQLIRTAPDDTRIIIFTHISPEGDATAWGEEIRNNGALRDLVAGEIRSGRKICIVHGHDHTDTVKTVNGIPVVGIGCSSMEDHKGTRPLTDGRFRRIPGTASEELADILVLRNDSDVLRFMRIGAGENRDVDIDG